MPQELRSFDLVDEVDCEVLQRYTAPAVRSIDWRQAWRARLSSIHTFSSVPATVPDEHAGGLDNVSPKSRSDKKPGRGARQSRTPGLTHNPLRQRRLDNKVARATRGQERRDAYSAGPSPSPGILQ